MGPDGIFYKPTLKPTNLLKLTAQSKDSKSTTSFPIGEKDGVYYAVSVERAEGMTVPFSFGWQRFQPPKSSWSVMLPNEPEPGKAALVAQSGKDALEDPDAYGVVKNTADLKSWQHFFQCGAAGKRLTDSDNKETYRVACTTYDPKTLKELCSDPKKNLDEAVHIQTVSLDGKVVQQKDVELAGAPGREFEIHADNGTTCVGRAYWVKDALYVLTVESPKDKPDAISTSKFLSSLEVQ